MKKHFIFDFFNILLGNILILVICPEFFVHSDRSTGVIFNFDKMLEIGLSLLIVLHLRAMRAGSGRQWDHCQIITTVVFYYDDRPIFLGVCTAVR